ncbi:hypothetical protein C0J52_14781 [Blattella germanica]|nr:hypothetical protein C0J52_14781 [Blattella germanica]
MGWGACLPYKLPTSVSKKGCAGGRAREREDPVSKSPRETSGSGWQEGRRCIVRIKPARPPRLARLWTIKHRRNQDDRGKC